MFWKTKEVTTGKLRMCFIRLPPPLPQGEKHPSTIKKINTVKEHLLIHVEFDSLTSEACKKF